jgi:hypothetical protein
MQMSGMNVEECGADFKFEGGGGVGVVSEPDVFYQY